MYSFLFFKISFLFCFFLILGTQVEKAWNIRGWLASMVERPFTLNKSCTYFQVLPCQSLKVRSPFGWPPGRRPVWGLNSHKALVVPRKRAYFLDLLLKRFSLLSFPGNNRWSGPLRDCPELKAIRQEESQRNRSAWAKWALIATRHMKFRTLARCWENWLGKESMDWEIERLAHRVKCNV